MDENAPIGVFDSGIGGLTALRQLINRMPNEKYIYLGDTARVPYGNKSESTIKQYAAECADFLLEHNVKMIIIACNTASALAYDTVKRLAKNVPVIEMIKPACTSAVQQSVNGKIGVIGTKSTIRSAAYEQEISKHSAFDNIRVFSEPCPLFVPIVEEGLVQHAATKLIAQDYLERLIDSNIDTLIMACTHYPFLTPVFKEILPDVKLIDTGAEAAIIAKNILEETGMRAKMSQDDENEYETDVEIYCTDNAEQFSEIAREFLDFDIPNPIKVAI